MPDNNPIGIFDSGIGGLTVAHAISKLLPKENIIYFGDTAHFPYGDKSPESIRLYSKRIANFLLNKGCKTIVIACNTASSFGYKSTKEYLQDKVPVVNVIDPVVEYVGKKYKGGKVGIIGTKGTIGSRIYNNRIKKSRPDIKTTSLATPLLAPMIEEGFYNNNISKTIINSYLSKPSFKGINALVLACTHYPLIKDEVAEFYNDNTDVLDSASIVAERVKEVLEEGNMERRSGEGKHQFYVSDYTAAYEESTKIFFSDKIQLNEVRLWD
ncbi:MAG: glutamate racemase [Flavobacteriales bacterium]|nr:glutamate racemase [Flavobacteriales bacterium]